MTTTRRNVLTGLSGSLFSAAVASDAFAARSGALPRGTEAILAESAPVGRFGFILVDVQSGQIMDGMNEDGMFIPASLSKIPTSYAAMHVHGPRAHFSTTLKITGPISGGVLQGDLHLVGGGDPSLDTQDLLDLAEQLRRVGIRRITGRFLYYGGSLPESKWLDKTQPWQAAYNPSMGGLNLNYNRVQFRWTREGKYLRVRGACRVRR